MNSTKQKLQRLYPEIRKNPNRNPPETVPGEYLELLLEVFEAKIRAKFYPTRDTDHYLWNAQMKILELEDDQFILWYLANFGWEEHKNAPWFINWETVGDD